MLHSGCLERHGESTATPVQPATSVGAVDSHTAPSGFFFHDTGRSGRVEGRTRRRCAVPASVPYSPFICCVVRSAQLMFAPLRLFSPEIDVLFFSLALAGGVSRRARGDGGRSLGKERGTGDRLFRISQNGWV